MTVAATAPRLPRIAHSAALGRHTSTTVSAGQPSASSNRADLTKGHALTHSTRWRKRATHLRPLAVASITIRNAGTVRPGVVRLVCATTLTFWSCSSPDHFWGSPVPATLRRERLPNKFPGFSPNLPGEITPCSRLTTGRNGSGRSTKLVFLLEFFGGRCRD